MDNELDPEIVIHREVLNPGQAWSRVVRRGQALRIVDVTGGATVAALAFNADAPLERYNMPDTLKGQYTAYLTRGHALHSDMGRILCSIIEDSCGWHDTMTGHLDAAGTRAKYGEGSYQRLRNDWYRNTRDNFLVELGKHGLGRRDLHANVNFFVRVSTDAAGRMTWVGNSRPGAAVDLRMDMNVLLVLSNTPHPLDPAPRYAPRPVELVRWNAPPRTADDLVALRRPENARAFTLTDRYFT